MYQMSREHTNGDTYILLKCFQSAYFITSYAFFFVCSIRHDDKQNGLDSSSDGSSGGGSSESDGSSEEEEEEVGGGDGRYHKKPGMSMMVQQEAPKFTVDGESGSGARGFIEVHRLQRHILLYA